MYQLPQINSFTSFIIFFIILLVAILIRYVLSAGLFYMYFFKAKHSARISRFGLVHHQIRNEIYWSCLSSIIFAFTGTITYVLWQQGYTSIYLSISEFGWLYLPISILIYSLLHETYYYWVHRFMHHPKVYKSVHKVHHDSLTPTPFTSFSFHPLEAILEALILPVLLLMIPIHPISLVVYLFIMTISSVINHLDVEIYPKWFLQSKIGQLFIGATHHHYHHEEFTTNYGLYFTFWDSWMKTESNQHLDT